MSLRAATMFVDALNTAIDRWPDGPERDRVREIETEVSSHLVGDAIEVEAWFAGLSPLAFGRAFELLEEFARLEDVVRAKAGLL